MLSKKTFLKAIAAINEHRQLMDELMVPLRKLGDFPLSLDFEGLHREALLQILQEVTGDDSDWIGWWLYEDVDKEVEYTENGVTTEIKLESAESLYDFLLDNVIQASHDTLPTSFLADDKLSKPRLTIERHNFSLFLEACLHLIDQNDVSLCITHEQQNKYVVLSAEHYEELTGERLRTPGPYFCERCKKEMEVPFISGHKAGEGYTIIAHCRNCNLDWEWKVKANGEHDQRTRSNHWATFRKE